MKKHAYYWPTTDRLAFEFAVKAGQAKDVTDQEGDDEDTKEEMKPATYKRSGFSPASVRSGH